MNHDETVKRAQDECEVHISSLTCQKGTGKSKVIEQVLNVSSHVFQL